MKNPLLKHLDEQLMKHPEKLALISSHGQLSFRGLHEASNAMAQALVSFGIKSNDKVLVAVPFSLDLYVLILALIKAGAVIVFVDPIMPITHIRSSLDSINVKAVVGLRKILLKTLLLPEFRKIPVKLSLDGSCRLLGIHDFKKTVSEASTEFVSEDADPGRDALLTFTTGSTGTPKGFVRTYQFLDVQHKHHVRYFPKEAAHPDFNSFPVIILSNIGSGVTTVLPAIHPKSFLRSDVRALLKQISDSGAATLMVPPMLLRLIASYAKEHNICLDAIRYVETGGAPTHPSTLRLAREVMPNASILLLYGSTEYEPISFIDYEEMENETWAKTLKGKGNCVGHPISDIKIRVIRLGVLGEKNLSVDLDLLTLASGEIGELIISDDYEGRSYYKNEQAFFDNKLIDTNKKVWHRLGDTGYLDEKNRIWLVGRINNGFSKQNRTYFPVQIESVVNGLPGVGQSAVFESNGKIVLVVDGDAGLESQIKNALTECLGTFVYDRLVFAKRFALDPRHNSKIDYTLMRRWYGRE